MKTLERVLLVNGNALHIPLPDESIHCAVTSPPFWGLRSYEGDQTFEWPTVEYTPMPGLPPIRIQGCEPGCKHVWGEEIPHTSRHRYTPENTGKQKTYVSGGAAPSERGSWCQRCGGWRGALGLEPTPEMYTGHLVLIWRELYRVLHPSGVCWLNLGDTFSSAPVGNFNGGSQILKNRNLSGHGASGSVDKAKASGLPEKNLVGIPDRVRFALQGDGWWVRSNPPWVKRNSLPESVTDRPTRATEDIYLLTKSERYFYDQDAIREPYADSSIQRVESGPVLFGGNKAEGYGTRLYSGNDWKPASHTFKRESSKRGEPIVGQGYGTHRPDREDNVYGHGGRNRRDTDWYFESLDRAIAEAESFLAHARHIKENGGVLVDEDGLPLVFQVNPRPYPGAHYAVFPPDLVEPMIKAGASEYGCCPECLAPWERVTEGSNPSKWAADDDIRSFHNDGKTANPQSSNSLHRNKGGVYSSKQTIGWQPTCNCEWYRLKDDVPESVLDELQALGVI